MRTSWAARIAAAGALLALSAGAALAEAGSLRVAKQFGLGYLQFMVMEDLKLVEKHAAAAGLGAVKTEWATFRSSDVMNDALISGSVDFVCLGPPGLITIWSRTRRNIDVRAASGLNLLPLILTVRDRSIQSLADFKDGQKIAVPAVKVSIQAIALQMAAARLWGDAEFQRLDPFTLSMAHPDATATMLAGGSEVVANFSSPPFQYRQLKAPGIRRLTSSDEILGGPYSFNVVATTGRFRADNPKLYGAFLSALQEATDIINGDRSRAVDIFLRLSGDKTPKEEIVDMMQQPGVQFTKDVVNLGYFSDFMTKVGTLKTPLQDWRTELVFPEATVR
jgi:NitT/TauT family transport system substrate-binding protein